MSVLGTYPLTGNSMAATGVATGLTLGDLTKNAGATATFNYAAASPAAGVFTDPLLSLESSSTTTADAVTNGRYFSLALTVAAGYTLSLTSLTLLASRAGTSTTRGFGVRSSADSFTATLLDTAVTESTGAAGTYTVDLSGAAFQSLGAGTTTFRFYIWTGGSGLALRMDDFTVNGTLTAPAGSVVPRRRAVAALTALGVIGKV